MARLKGSSYDRYVDATQKRISELQNALFGLVEMYDTDAEGQSMDRWFSDADKAKRVDAARKALGITRETV